jgi:signal transduction histidine kinase
VSADEPQTSGLLFLGRLAGGLVHEIKNPLSTLSINLSLLKEDLAALCPDAHGVHHRVETIEKEVSRLDAVLNDFLRYAGMRRLDRKPCDLRTVVRELADFVGPGFRRDGIELEVDVPSVQVELDAPLFKQALLNVLLNAQQACAEGQGGRVVIRGAADRVEVEDDGCGIPEADRARVFDVYYSGSKQGSGLGLPTARRILEEHGGRIELESEEGAGTRVTLILS